MLGLPVVHRHAIGLPVVHCHAIGLPVVHRHAIGLPVVHRHAIGLPVVHRHVRATSSTPSCYRTASGTPYEINDSFQSLDINVQDKDLFTRNSVDVEVNSWGKMLPSVMLYFGGFVF